MKTIQLFGFGILTAALLTLGCAHDKAGGGGATTAAASSGATDGKAQATRGGQLYGQHCASCHGAGGEGNDKAPPVVGKAALPLDPPATAKYRKTQFHTARDVYDFTKANMPAKAPGSLAEDEYLSIVAFDLQANGVDLTGKTITPDSLIGIVLHP
jgi:mono/diheme cytochrome c family protein